MKTLKIKSQSSFGDDQMVNSIEMQGLETAGHSMFSIIRTPSMALWTAWYSFTGLTTREPEDAQFARRIQLDSNDGQSKIESSRSFLG